MVRIGYTPGDVAELLEVSTRNVRLLIEQEVLIPSVPARGRGRSRLFNHPDLVAAGVAFRLREAGIAPKSLALYVKAYTRARVRRTVDQEGDDQPTAAAGELLVFGMHEENISTLEAWIMEHSDEEVGQGDLSRRVVDLAVTVTVNIGHLRAELDSRLSQLG